MKLKINRNKFLKEIQKIQNITPIKATKPILSSFLLQTTDEGVYLSATDLNVGIRIFCPTQVVTHGELCMPARIVYDILRELPEDSEIEVILEENNRLRFSCFNSMFHVPSTPSLDFPQFPDFDIDSMFPLPLDLLVDMFMKVNVVVPFVEQKIYGAPPGALFSIDSKGFEMAGTDGLRMAYVRLPGVNLPIEKSILLPKKLLEELPKLLIEREKGAEPEAAEQEGEEGENSNKEAAKDDTVIKTRIGLTDNHIMFSWPNNYVFACLMENKFPDYKGAIAVQNDKVLILDKERFRQAVRRVSLISEKREWFIRFKLVPGKMFLDSEKMELGDAHDEIDVDYQGEPLDIGFNPKYILDFLSVTDSSEVSLELAGPKTLAILKPKDNKNVIFIVMPVRL